MKNKIAIIAILSGIFLSYTGTALCSQDDGTGPDGVVVICSRMLAMRCGLSSEDGGDADKIKECFDKIASDTYGSQTYKQSVSKTRDQVLHECSKVYYEQSIKYKADAGDYVDKGDENGNSELKTDKHGKKEQEGKVAASNSQNIIKLMDISSSLLILDSLETMFANISNREISEEMKNNGEETPLETSTETSEGGSDE